MPDIAAVCDQYCLQLWDVAGNWIAGFGTLAAVIVSLWIARRQAPRLRVRAGIRVLIGQGVDPENLPRMLAIYVANLGPLPVKIEGVGWRKSKWSREHALQTLPRQLSGITLPHTLDPHDSVDLYIDLEDSKADWGQQFARDFVGLRFPRIAVRFLLVSAWTPSGAMFYSRIEKSLRDYIVDQARIASAADSEARKPDPPKA